MTTEIDAPEVPFEVIDAATGGPLKLAMQELRLTGRLLPVGARLMVRHVFRSAATKPIEAIYSFMLPRDAALRRFRIVGEGFRVESDLKPVAEAIKAYEKGIERGRLAGIARHYRDGLVNLTVGNLRPGETVAVYLELIAGVENRDDGFRFRFPFTVAPTYHPRALSVSPAPGVGEIEMPEDLFGDAILPAWRADASDLHRIGFEVSVALPGGAAEISSPSHPVRVAIADGAPAGVSLATAGDVPNRDLIIDVRARKAEPTVLAGVGSDGKGRVAAVIPSGSFGRRSEKPASVVFVVDRSGSMEGVEMQHALKSVEVCLGALGPRDRFSIVAFDDRTEVFAAQLREATSEAREEAKRFLAKINARGGTELLQALQCAFTILEGAGGDVLLITDGQVSETERIFADAKAAGVRVHCLGIGSASQDRFLSLLARETGGTSRFLSPSERVDLAAVALFGSIGRPVATDIKVEVTGLDGAQVSPQPASAIHEGTPLVLFGAAPAGGEGEIVISWEGDGERKHLALPVNVGADGDGETLRMLHGARLITDLEAQYAEELEGETGRLERRRQTRIGRVLEELGREYGLANRCLALVAVVERAGDIAGEVPHTTIVPVGMPEGVAFGAYFEGACLLNEMHRTATRQWRCAFHADLAPGPRSLRLSPAPDETTVELLMELASRIEPDGGMPGATPEDRILATLLALIAFASDGRVAPAEVFRPHIARLLAFLDAADLAPLADEQQAAARAVADRLRAGKSLRGSWRRLAREYLQSGTVEREKAWESVGKALGK
jgi:Mg-chelatase subunit ChlD